MITFDLASFNRLSFRKLTSQEIFFPPLIHVLTFLLIVSTSEDVQTLLNSKKAIKY